MDLLKYIKQGLHRTPLSIHGFARFFCHHFVVGQYRNSVLGKWGRPRWIKLLTLYRRHFLSPWSYCLRRKRLSQVDLCSVLFWGLLTWLWREKPCLCVGDCPSPEQAGILESEAGLSGAGGGGALPVGLFSKKIASRVSCLCHRKWTGNCETATLVPAALCSVPVCYCSTLVFKPLFVN